MKRRAYALLVANAVIMGALALICSVALDLPIRDPDGFLGPGWLRLPLLVLGAFVLDVVPRTLWRSRGNPAAFKRVARGLIREHWTRDRIQLVVIGLICFYLTYVSYRNLKNFLPFIRSTGDGPLKYDHALHELDEKISFGKDPALLLHDLLGTGVSAHVLSWVYLFFLPMVPIAVIAWVVWSRNVNFGYWFVTADCLTWTLGTLSYYLIPTLGPNFVFPFLYRDLPDTGVSQLQDALASGRESVRFNPTLDAVQSVAGFASLHVGITLMMALIAHYTVRNRVVRIVLWVNMTLTVIATTYFGWHYVADDVAGVAIAFTAVWVAGLATGQKFDRHGRSSHPTSTGDEIPVAADSDG